MSLDVPRPGADRGAANNAAMKRALLCGLVLIGLVMPFAGKPVHLDDANFLALARGAGATFVARTTTYHVMEMIDIIKKAILHKGFSVVEIMSQCPTYYGRKNKLGGAVELMESFQENTVKIGSKKADTFPELIKRGIFVQENQPEYVESYQALTAALQDTGTTEGGIHG